MGRGSGAGLVRVGSLGGKVICNLASATQSLPDLLEAFGFRIYTFELLSTDPITGAALVPSGTCVIEFTNDLLTANQLGGSNWSPAGIMNTGGASPQLVVTWDKPAKAF